MAKRKRILKPQFNDGSNQNWFSKAVIGSAFNSEPAVMTASGWNKDSKGEWRLKRTKATDQLAENLELISMTADGTGGIAAIKDTGKLAWNLIRHPARTLKQIKNLGILTKNVVTKGGKKIGHVVNNSVKHNKVLRKVAKQVTAKKRVLAARLRISDNLEKAKKETKRLNNLINNRYKQNFNTYGNYGSDKERIASRRTKRIENAAQSRIKDRKQRLNWDRMSVEQAKKIVEKEQLPVDIKPVRIKFKDPHGKDVEKVVPGYGGWSSTYDNAISTGDYQIPDFTTGQSVAGTLKINRHPLLKPKPIEGFYPMPDYELVEQPVLLENMGRVVSGNDELRKVTKANIRYLQEEIPGFKPFGSSVGEAEGAIVHNTHDIDGYVTRDIIKQLLKKGLIVETNPGETYLYKVQNGKFGKAGNVDLNVLNIDENGKIGNSRTAEMYRLFFPLEYQKQARELAGSRSASGDFSNLRALDANGNVLTEQQLLDAYDPLVKTIMDSGEIDFTNPNKTKHAGRFLEYLVGDNPKAVHRALDLESKRAGALGHLLPKMKFRNPEENAAILNKIGFTGDIGTAINDPNKMQNILDYWYLSARRNYRAVNAGDYRGGGESVEHLMKNLTDWNASNVNSGGYGSGFGLNSTIDGPSRMSRTIDGYIQPKISGLSEMSDPNEVIDIINHSYGLNLTPTEKELIAERFGYKFTASSDDSEDLLRQIPSFGEDTKKTLEQASRDFGINAFTGAPYNGDSLYSGIARRLDPSKDAIGTMLSTDASIMFGAETYPSWTTRMKMMVPRRHKLPFVRTVKGLDLSDYLDPLYFFDRKLRQKSDFYHQQVHSLDRRLGKMIRLGYNVNKNTDRLKNAAITSAIGVPTIGGLVYLIDNNDRYKNLAKDDLASDYNNYIKSLNAVLDAQRKLNGDDKNYTFDTIRADLIPDQAIELNRNRSNFLDPNWDFINRYTKPLKKP